MPSRRERILKLLEVVAHERMCLVCFQDVVKDQDLLEPTLKVNDFFDSILSENFRCFPQKYDIIICNLRNDLKAMSYLAKNCSCDELSIASMVQQQGFCEVATKDQKQ